jgi:hypothetical protein
MLEDKQMRFDFHSLNGHRFDDSCPSGHSDDCTVITFKDTMINGIV